MHARRVMGGVLHFMDEGASGARREEEQHGDGQYPGDGFQTL